MCSVCNTGGGVVVPVTKPLRYVWYAVRTLQNSFGTFGTMSIPLLTEKNPDFHTISADSFHTFC